MSDFDQRKETEEANRQKINKEIEEKETEIIEKELDGENTDQEREELKDLQQTRGHQELQSGKDQQANPYKSKLSPEEKRKHGVFSAMKELGYEGKLEEELTEEERAEVENYVKKIFEIPERNYKRVTFGSRLFMLGAVVGGIGMMIESNEGIICSLIALFLFILPGFGIIAFTVIGKRNKKPKEPLPPETDTKQGN